jgi:hypothetical protein
LNSQNVEVLTPSHQLFTPASKVCGGGVLSLHWLISMADQVFTSNKEVALALMFKAIGGSSPE